MDLKWFQQHLLEDILPHWLQHAVTETGCFLPHFDRQWNPLGQDYATLVSQSRLLYNFCIGYELTQDDEYLQVVEKGIRFLLGTSGTISMEVGSVPAGAMARYSIPKKILMDMRSPYSGFRMQRALPGIQLHSTLPARQ